MRTLPVAIITVSMAAALAACGGSSSSGNPSGGSKTPAANAPNGVSNPTAAKAEIAALYPKFFAAPPAVAKTLLEDGPTLSAAFVAAEKLKGKATERVTVTNVKITSASTATVTYNLFVGATKNPTLKGSVGAAVFNSGQWKVAKATFCGLVELGTPNVKGCGG